MKKSKTNYNYIFMILVLLVLCLFPSFTNTYTSAEERVYSGVLYDLQIDESFNTAEYPVDEDDYSLNVINIAESEDKELFIYVYQPSAHFGNLTASSINISPYLHEEINVSNYKLKLLNYSGVFYKYLVEDFTVSEASTRYYEIISIFRPWDEEKDNDKTPTNENTIDEVAYKVAKQYTVYEEDGKVIYSCSILDTLEITDMYVGFLRYFTGANVGAGTYDWQEMESHFIAFSTNIPIDKIYSAKILYTSQYAHASGYFTTAVENYPWEFDKPVENEVVVNAEHEQTIDVDAFWIHHTYTFPDIQTVAEFLETEDRENIQSGVILDTYSYSKITDEGLEDLKNMQWVIRFASTEFMIDINGILPSYAHFTQVSEATILQLFFESDGDVYNLGVVANKQTSDGVPDNEEKIWFELAEWFKWVLGIIGIILLVVLIVACWPIVSVVLSAILKAAIWLIKMIGKGLGYFFYGLWWVISSPIALFDEDGA